MSLGRHAIIPVLSTILVACGDPCLPHAFGDTSVIAADTDCVHVDTTGIADTNGASSSVTMANSSGDDSGDSSGEAPPNPITCVAVPEAGKFWGPCIAGACSEGACELSGGTSICVPGCTEDLCNIGVCLNGTCDDEWKCVGPCTGAEDCAPGMACNDLGHCAWPE